MKKHKINFHCVYTELLNTYTLPFIGNNHVFFSGFVIYYTFSISIRHSVASWLDFVVFFFICIYMNNVGLLLCLALIRSFSRTHQNGLCSVQSREEQSKVNVCCLRSLRSCRLRSSNRFRLRRDAHVLNSFATAKISLYGIPLPQYFGKLVCFISFYCQLLFVCTHIVS